MTHLVERLRKPVMLHYSAETVNAERSEAATALEAKDKELAIKDQAIADMAHTIYELQERVHYAEGVSDLAIKHRDEAEARAETAEQRVKLLEARQADDLAEFSLMEVRAETAERERDEAREALRFYADPANWRPPSSGFTFQYDPEPSAIHKDYGRAARAITGGKP